MMASAAAPSVAVDGGHPFARDGVVFHDEDGLEPDRHGVCQFRSAAPDR
jgi:hypothetical protein